MAHLDEAAIVRDWLAAVMRKTGMKPTPLAKAAGLAPSTILRALDAERPGALDLRSITKIVDKFGIAAPPALFGAPAQSRPAGFAEPELVMIPADAGQTFAGEALSPTQGVWSVHTRAIELAGYLPGDQVLADSAAPPRPRDVVVAQIVDHRSGTAETVLRVYDPPYLTTETADPAARQKPALVDNDRVAIWGPVVKSLRARDA